MVVDSTNTHEGSLLSGLVCRCYASAASRNPVLTDEGVRIHQADPTTNAGHGLVWGSVLWPSGTCLAKFLAWRAAVGPKLDDGGPKLDRTTRVLELGCGTGVAGLTAARLGARHVTLSDAEPALWPLLRQSIEENQTNGMSGDGISMYGLDWRDVSTFLDPAIPQHSYDLILAADVLYAGMDSASRGVWGWRWTGSRTRGGGRPGKTL